MSKYMRYKLPYETHNVRMSQIVSTFGPGSIMDFRDQTLMTAAPKYWDENYDVIHDERLEKKLHVSEFRIHKDEKCNRGVPFVRFPNWYFCPKCKKFQHISKWEKEYKPIRKNSNEFMLKPKCMNCKIPIIPSSILIACENGHINDFPWIEWVHLHKGKICKNPQLRIVTESGILGLEGFRVKCIECNASNSLKGALNKNTFRNIVKTSNGNLDENLKNKFKCTGNMPWKGVKEKQCSEFPRTILRNASNIYFPKIESSILIPPYSEELNYKIENSHEFGAFLSAKNKSEKKGKLDRFLEEDLEDYIEDIAKEIKEEDNIYAIRKILERKIEAYDEENSYNRNFYRAEEYDALLGKISESFLNSSEFKIVLKNNLEYGIDQISNVTLVKKLKEVRALVGYTRINPPLAHIMGTDKSSDKSKVVNIKEYEDRWYPAYEVRGEGIFIELNTELINKWEKNNKVKNRAAKLNARYNKDKDTEFKREITPKFLLLHTFAHILIKELSFECGYSATSLRERIYCNSSEKEMCMSGILIYTASGDSEGSLGGLVKQGNPEFLSKIIKNAINKIKWCSSDPICINSNGQGRDSLNLSACHNCVLLPETSCEEFNILLDRAMLVGTLKNKDIGFFEKLVID